MERTEADVEAARRSARKTAGIRWRQQKCRRFDERGKGREGGRPQIKCRTNLELYFRELKVE
jgi:hypothetical protein